MITNGNFFSQYINGELNTQASETNFLLTINSEICNTERNVTLILKNEMNLIVGATGSGKSKIGAYFIRQIISPKCDNYFLIVFNIVCFVIWDKNVPFLGFIDIKTFPYSGGSNSSPP